jgi:hypothetical protein
MYGHWPIYCFSGTWFNLSYGNIIDADVTVHHQKLLECHLFLVFSDNLLVLLGFSAMQDKRYTYIIRTYKIILHWLRNRTEKLAFRPVSIACTNKYYIFWQCMYVVYIFNLLCFALSYFHFSVIWCFIVVFQLSRSWRFILFSPKDLTFVFIIILILCLNAFDMFTLYKSHTALVIKEWLSVWLLFNANSAICSYIMARTS